MIAKHVHSTTKVGPANHLYGKTVYIPSMEPAAAKLLAAAFRWLGINSIVTPPSDAHSLQLAAEVLGGDECYPAKVTMGDVLRVVDAPDFDAKNAVVLIASSDGPCRLGQYSVYMKKVLKQRGMPGVEILSPSDNDGYTGFGDISGVFVRTAWRIIVASDILRRLLLKTRPYETVLGSADAVFNRGIQILENAVEQSCSRPACQLRDMRAALIEARRLFQQVSVDRTQARPRVAVVGELFCRLNTFSNEDLVRKLEEHGAEALLSGLSEWIHYTNFDEDYRLRLYGHKWSLAMLVAKVRHHFQYADERFLLAPFRDDFSDQPHVEAEELMRLGERYLPYYAVAGEMVVSAGTGVHMSRSNIDGIVDISPFTCMNGIVSEALYPKISRDCGGIPIRSFYFDGTHKSLNRELGVYMELVRSYRERRLADATQSLPEVVDIPKSSIPDVEPDPELADDLV